LAALRKQWLEVTAGGIAQRVLPINVFTRDGAEWLLAEPSWVRS
jgi:Rho-binding antiterminator